MRLVKRILTRKKQALVAECERCYRQFEIPYSNAVNPNMSSIDLKSTVQCECGEYHNLIIDEIKHKSITSTPSTQARQSVDAALKCPRCGSAHLHAGDKGFGL